MHSSHEDISDNNALFSDNYDDDDFIAAGTADKKSIQKSPSKINGLENSASPAANFGTTNQD